MRLSEGATLVSVSVCEGEEDKIADGETPAEAHAEPPAEPPAGDSAGMTPDAPSTDA